MERIVLEVNSDTARRWRNANAKLREEAVNRLVEKLMLSSDDTPIFPSGTEKLDLAIELAESGVPANVITKVTHLLPEVFEAFMPK